MADPEAANTYIATYGPEGIASLIAAHEGSPPDTPEGRRARWARHNFEHWARNTSVSTCRDWSGLAPSEKAIWIDMVTVMEGCI